ncbi:MAG: 3-phosphoshikimate 1-carboxyvinyltransferase [Pedobacter sp.]|nr:MAG: 3-phosphoshikimate 1-carboxyvinyltransferase [Pedobacter sp.]
MSKNVLLSFTGNKQIDTEIKLTGSKSECNRALVISALSKGWVSVENLSVAADTVTLNKVLNELGEKNLEFGNISNLKSQISNLVDIGPAGTAMRFLTAFLAIQDGKFFLTGTERMKQRPIGILVEALKSIGGNISYEENEGFPPLQILGPFKQTSKNVFLPGLNGYSLQGDSKITEIMANFGITSQFKNGGVYLKKEPKQIERKIFDLKECPDLAQTIVVICAALGHDATFTGLETLKIKETNRVLALQTELAKIGVKFIEKNLSYKLDCAGLHFPEKIKISTYEDHRMAMAFAPLALKIKEVEIEEKQVVEKSYPYFWDDLEKAGLSVVST